MYSGFTKLLWGFVFLFDFRLNGIDILPDPIGYLLIFLGMTSLMVFFKEFINVRWIAFVLIFTSIPSVVQEQGIAINSSSGLQLGQGYFLVMIITTIASLILLYTIFMGISHKATEHGLYDLASLSKTTWILTLILTLSLYIVMAMLFLAIPLIILGLVNFVLQLVVINRARNQFTNIDFKFQEYELS